MLKIENLHVNVEDKKILQGLNLKISPGETHAIMGPNGSGKSTLANVLSGKEGYDVKKGLPLLRSSWIQKRDIETVSAKLFTEFHGDSRPKVLRGKSNVSQMHYARKGEITEEMYFVAKRETRCYPHSCVPGRGSCNSHDVIA